jgi:hypothetical protein
VLGWQQQVGGLWAQAAAGATLQCRPAQQQRQQQPRVQQVEQGRQMEFKQQQQLLLMATQQPSPAERFHQEMAAV